MQRVLRLLCLGAALAPASGTAEPEPTVRPSSHELARVAVIRPPGLQTYEELIDEFRGRVRAAVRVVGARAAERAALHAWLGGYRPRVILAVGQSAYDLVRDVRLPVVSALALRRSPSARDPAVILTVPTTSVLAAFRAARPGIERIGVLHGPQTFALVAGAQAESRLLGFEMLHAQASSPEEAISRLRALGRQAQGLWLVPDLDILSPQVLQYALMLQFRRHQPLLGATRRHTRQGALFALDHDPEDLGRQAAVLTNQLLAGQVGTAPALPAKLSLNLATAQRIGVDSPTLRRCADRVYQ